MPTPENYPSQLSYLCSVDGQSICDSLRIENNNSLTFRLLPDNDSWGSLTLTLKDNTQNKSNGKNLKNFIDILSPRNHKPADVNLIDYSPINHQPITSNHLITLNPEDVIHGISHFLFGNRNLFEVIPIKINGNQNDNHEKPSEEISHLTKQILILQAIFASTLPSEIITIECNQRKVQITNHGFKDGKQVFLIDNINL